MNGTVKEIGRTLIIAALTAGVTAYTTVQVLAYRIETAERAVLELKASDIQMRIEFRADLKQNRSDIQKIFEMAAERFQKFTEIYRRLEDNEARIRVLEKKK